MKYQTEAENPYVLFGGRILYMDSVTESRLIKNIRAHRVQGGVCADVTHGRSEFGIYLLQGFCAGNGTIDMFQRAGD